MPPVKLSNGKLYKSLFENLINGFAHCQAIYDNEGNLIDWVYLLVNHAFEVQTGIKDALGKRVTEIIPDIAETDNELFRVYERVSKGVSRYEHLEYFLSALGIWFSITVYSVEPDTFTVVFENVNEKKKQILELQQANADILLAFVRALKFRDRETDKHSERVTELTMSLAKKLGLTEIEITHIYEGSLLHDIGKMFIPDAILQKPSKLTMGEMAIMRLHPQHSYDLLSPIKSLAHSIDIPYSHHEKWDGSGYPQGLVGKEIPFAARLFSIVDVYDAITSHRPYREPMEKSTALEYIKSEAGTAFDPDLVEFFVREME